MFTKDVRKISKWQILVIICVQIILDETRGARPRHTAEAMSPLSGLMNGTFRGGAHFHLQANSYFYHSVQRYLCRRDIAITETTAIPSLFVIMQFCSTWLSKPLSSLLFVCFSPFSIWRSCCYLLFSLLFDFMRALSRLHVCFALP